VISRKNRFHGHASLRYVHQKGKTVRGPYFMVKSAHNPRRSDYRVAVVISRKVHKSAVARNRIRRRLYTAVRLLKTDINGPYDIVLNVYEPKISEQSSKRLATLVKKQLAAAGALKQSTVQSKDD
jgi:ribonuclease P protein component